MSETADYDPGPWRGHTFSDARKAYDVHAGRSYADAVSKNITKADCVPPSLTTHSEAPVVIVCDITASMGDWPSTIFSKLPYLDKEGKEYLGPSMEISFAAIGDYECHSKYPLQVRPFAKELTLKEELEKLIVEGGGGGTMEESYDLAALYYARQVNMPNAINPIFIFIGDESYYSVVNEGAARDWCHTTNKGAGNKILTFEEVIEELKQKFSVYLVRKPYGSSNVNTMDSNNTNILNKWMKVLGEDHICTLPDASRVVDVIFGIFARETNRIDYFKDEIEDRQRPDQVDVVMKSLKTVHLTGASVKKIAGPKKGASVTRKSTKGSSSKSLLD